MGGGLSRPAFTEFVLEVTSIQFRDRLYQMKRPRMTFSKSLARFESDRSKAVESRVVGLVWFANDYDLREFPDVGKEG